jgi:hypothetical protein
VGVGAHLCGDRVTAICQRFGVKRLSVAVSVPFILSAVVCAGPASASAVSPSLPDERTYELVSTSGLFGEPYQPTSPTGTQFTGLQESEHPFEAAEGGDAFSYVGEPPGESGGSGETGPGEGNQWLATRTTTGWHTLAITPSAASPRAGSEHVTYQAFASDLTSGIFEGGAQPLTPDIPSGCHGLYSRATAGGAYQSLFTTQEAPSALEPCGRPLFAGAAAENGSVIFQSEGALTEGAEPTTELPPGRSLHSETGAESGEPCMFGCNLYESLGGQLRLVNVVEGVQVPSATFGGYPGEVSGLTNFSHAISTDGSRIFWTDTQPGPRSEHVFVLENGVSTVEVSGAGHAEYWTASPDGRYCFYTEAGALWRFDTHTNTREDIAPESAAVQGVIGTNTTGQDGAYVYFVAQGVLASNKREYKNREGAPIVEEAKAGEDNLYLDHEGQTTFVAVLAPADNEIVTSAVERRPGGDWKANLGERTAEVTPDGHHLVFESMNPLTGYDNQSPTRTAMEVFTYTAANGALICASCNPEGRAPTAPERGNETRLPASATSDTYMRRWISDDGMRVFFDSAQPLVSRDTNEVQDVYEWEREGTSGCPSATSRFGGCIFLLSAANSRGYSFLIDADRTGSNVFFEHQGPLGQIEAPVDYNELYDARVGGGFTSSVDPCAATGCPGAAPEPPSFPSPASATSSGIGNFTPQSLSRPRAKTPTRAQLLAKALKACHAKKSKQLRVTCERQARKRYGPSRVAAKKGHK